MTHLQDNRGYTKGRRSALNRAEQPENKVGIDPQNAREGSVELLDRMILYHRKYAPGSKLAHKALSWEVYL
jgi:hypothetical protein